MTLQELCDDFDLRIEIMTDDYDRWIRRLLSETGEHQPSTSSVDESNARLGAMLELIEAHILEHWKRIENAPAYLRMAFALRRVKAHAEDLIMFHDYGILEDLIDRGFLQSEEDGLPTVGPHVLAVLDELAPDVSEVCRRLMRESSNETRAV